MPEARPGPEQTKEEAEEDRELAAFILADTIHCLQVVRDFLTKRSK